MMMNFSDHAENQPARGWRKLNMPVFRVMLTLNIIPGQEKMFEQTWLSVGKVITDQPSNLGQWLLRNAEDGSVYHIVSDWADEQSFRQFERSDEHLGHRQKLHPYRSGGSMTTMHVVYDLPANRVSQC
jgi:heme oxygenase (mycobilin-producing)